MLIPPLLFFSTTGLFILSILMTDIEELENKFIEIKKLTSNPDALNIFILTLFMCYIGSVIVAILELYGDQLTKQIILLLNLCAWLATFLMIFLGIKFTELTTNEKT